MPPEVPALLGIENDTGQFADDLLTTDQGLIFVGLAEANSTVTVFLNGSSIGTTVADGSGQWRFDHSAKTLAEGLYQVTLQAANAAGSSAVSAAQQLVIDITPDPGPVLTALADDSGDLGDFVTNDGTLTFTGTAQPNETVTLFLDGTQIGTVQGDAAGDFTFDYTSVDLADGFYTLTATDRDTAGNVSNLSTPFEFLVDKTPPAASSVDSINPESGSNTTDGITNTGQLNFIGTADPNTIVVVYLDGGPLGFSLSDTMGAWSYDHTATTLADGTYALTAAAIDAADNLGPQGTPLSVTVDTTAPMAPNFDRISTDDGTDPLDGITSDQTLVIFGNAEAGATVTISLDGTQIGTATADAMTNWSFDYTGTTLAPGSYTFSATATDAAGNTSGAAQFPVQIVAPNLVPIVTGITDDTGFDGADGLTMDPTLVITGTGPANTTVEVLLEGQVLGTTTADAAGVWSYDNTANTLANGLHLATARSVDGMGNRSAESAPFAIDVDTAAPVSPSRPDLDAASDSGRSDSDDDTSTQGVGISLTAEAGTTVTLTSSLDGQLSQGNVPGNGTLTFLGNVLSEGDHQITAVAVDGAGNSSGPSLSLDLRVDRTAPNAPTVSEYVVSSDKVDDSSGATNDNTPTLRGTAERNSDVVVFYQPVSGGASQSLGTARTDAAGNWTLDAQSTTLPDGDAQFTAQATDAAGNTSGSSTPLLKIIDAAGIADAPVLTSWSVDTGRSSTDAITNDATPTFNGTGTPGDFIQVVLNNGLASNFSQTLGTATVAADGTWSITPAQDVTPDDTYTLTIGARRPGGSQFTTVDPIDPFIIDTTTVAPEITKVSTPNGTLVGSTTTHDASVTFEGTAEADSDVVLTVSGGNAPSKTVRAAADGTWSVTFTNAELGEDVLTAKVTATDAAGNTAQPPGASFFTFFVAPPGSPPRITAYINDQGTRVGTETNDATPVFEGIGSAFSTVEVFRLVPGGTLVSLGTAMVDAQSVWTLQAPGITLPDGTYDFAVRGTQPGGIVSPLSASVQVTIDTVAPAIPLIGSIVDSDGDLIANGGATDKTAVTVNGTAEPGAEVFVLIQNRDPNGASAVVTTTAAADGTWSVDSSASSILDAQATYDITVNAEDAAGNDRSTTQPISFSVDTVAPNISFGLRPSNDTGTKGDGITSADVPEFDLEKDNSDTVTFRLPNNLKMLSTRAASLANNREFLGFTLVDRGPPTTALTGDFMADITAVVTDPAGNSTEQTVKFEFNAAPNDITLTSTSVAENSPQGTTVGMIEVLNQFGPEIWESFALRGRDGALFQAVPVKGQPFALQVGSNANFDFETQTSYEIELAVNDAAGSTFSKTFTINIADVPELTPGILAGDDGDNVLLAGDGNNTVVGGPGADTATLGQGADTYRDSALNLNGDRLTDFGLEDLLLIEDFALKRSDFTFDEGRNTVQVDLDGDGTPDVTFMLDGDYSGGEFMIVGRGGQSRVTYETYLPSLGEGMRVDPGAINGINNQEFLTGDGSTDFRVTLNSALAGADNRNALGVYEVDANGNIVDVRILFVDPETDEDGMADITGVEDGHELGFFLIQDGVGFAFFLPPEAELSFVDADGGTGSVDEEVFLAVNGAVAGQTVFHSYAGVLNPDGQQHALTGVDPGGTSVTVGFEDQMNTGDSDYQDLVFSVQQFDGL